MSDECQSSQCQSGVPVAIVFIGAAGKPPVDQPATIGQIAINQQTNEKWFVNTNNQWQQQVGV